ncbi:hypothetical protein E2562_029366 [Oryza meyeriana var. granulata]|uniref:Uncharacterized protein n=1 Tax=Oryza meyeriana var. granulata TaxID=110450 RepID=A0A6G1CA17_9ORYZ|nr:hypothetical protein E2562_029366 [Oryza meyeriana var. granulata]
MRDDDCQGHQDKAVMKENDPTSINHDLVLQGLAPDDDDDLVRDAEALFGSSAAPINVDGNADGEFAPGTPTIYHTASTGYSNSSKRTRSDVWEDFAEVFEEGANGKKVQSHATCIHSGGLARGQPTPYIAAASRRAASPATTTSNVILGLTPPSCAAAGSGCDDSAHLRPAPPLPLVQRRRAAPRCLRRALPLRRPLTPALRPVRRPN